jgi:adenosylcobinamide-GDP ribazoletransferase
MARPFLRERDALDGGPAPLAELRAAVAFLTRLPVGDALVDRSGATAFAIVGGAIGLVASVPLLLLGEVVPVVAAILSLALLAVASGALHLDGLADTADALVAVGPDAAERARKDPAAGPAGVVAIVALLGVQAAALSSVVADGGPVAAASVLVAAVSASRSAAVVLAWAQRASTRGGSGSGARFSDAVTGTAAAATVFGTAAIAALASLVGDTITPALTALACGLGGLLLGGVVIRLRHQLDGDGFGAAVELAMASGLVAAVVLWAAGR